MKHSQVCVNGRALTVRSIQWLGSSLGMVTSQVARQVHMAKCASVKACARAFVPDGSWPSQGFRVCAGKPIACSASGYS